MTHAVGDPGHTDHHNTLDAADALRIVGVVHGAVAGTARPTTTLPVLWVGSVQPTNAVTNDLWWNTTSSAFEHFNGSTWDIQSAVASFNTRTGAVTLSKADVTGTGLAASDVGASATGHSHAESDVASLVSDLAGKSPTVHTHAEADVTNLTTDLAAKIAAASAQGAAVSTQQTTTSLTYTDLTTTGPAVTVTIGASGRALVLLAADASNSTAGDAAAMAFAVSGATTRAAADEALWVRSAAAGSDVEAAAFVFLTGLTAGSNTFTAKYRAGVGGTATFNNRYIFVLPL